MFRWPVRVYYEDTDAGGVVYHANYLRFMERARSEWLRHLGFEQDALISTHGLLFVVRTAALTFRRPARFNDRLVVEVRLISRRAAELRFDQAVLRAVEGDGEELVCAGAIGVACLDSERLRPRRIPQFLLAEIDRER